MVFRYTLILLFKSTWCAYVSFGATGIACGQHSQFEADDAVFTYGKSAILNDTSTSEFSNCPRKHALFETHNSVVSTTTLIQVHI